MTDKNRNLLPPSTVSVPINIPGGQRHSVASDNTTASPKIPATPPPTPELFSNPPSVADDQFNSTSSNNTPLAPVPPRWLDNQFLEHVLRLRHPEVTVTEAQMEPAVAAGENYMTLVFRARIKTEKENSDGTVFEEVHSLIIKCIPEFQKNTFVSENALTVREMDFYNKTLPLLTKTGVNRCNLSSPVGKRLNDTFLVPTCYYSIHENDLKDALILQDLKPMGYQTVHRQLGLDGVHCELALLELAKFHASSIRLKHLNPEIFESEIVNKYVEHMFSELNCQTFSDYLKVSLENLAQVIGDNSDYFPSELRHLSKIINRLAPHIYDFMYKALNEYKFVNGDETQIEILERNFVLTHGDFWSNNILFKYENDNGDFLKPISCCILDFQMIKYNAAVLDLLYFFYTSTTLQTRRAHLDQLLQCYLNQVNDSLKTDDLFASSKIPFYENISQIKSDFKKYAVYGFGCSCMGLPLMLADSKDAPDFDTIEVENMQKDTNGDGVEPLRKLYKGQAFRKRFTEVLQDFEEQGFFTDMENELKSIL